MSLDLVDLKRLKITEETRAWLQSEALRTKRSQQEIVREELHHLALEKIHAARVLVSLAPSEGHGGAGRGRAAK